MSELRGLVYIVAKGIIGQSLANFSVYECAPPSTETIVSLEFKKWSEFCFLLKDLKVWLTNHDTMLLV